MSSEKQAAPGASKKNVLPLIMVGVVGGVLIGGPTGAIIGAPMVVKNVTGQEAKAAEHKEEEDEGKSSTIYVMEDIVLNPAGTEGQRFLIARVGLQGTAEEFEADMTTRDAEVRDVVVRMLSSKTVAELADPVRREAVKKELQVALAARFPKAGIRAVLFPQFVIQ